MCPAEISFNGDIDNSTLDIKTVYRTTTSLKDVLPNDASPRRVPVNAYLELQDELMSPSIRFSFELPNATTEDNALLSSVLNVSDQANAARQFFSLLLTSNFLMQNDQTSTIESSIAKDMGIEMLSSVLNNLLFDRIRYINLGINYKTANVDAGQGQEAILNASIPVWGDRILIETSLGYVDKTKYNPNNILGDVSIEFMMTESGNWRLKAFYTTNNYDADALQQTSWGAAGVGIGYKQDFNDAKDLKAAIKRKKKQK